MAWAQPFFDFQMALESLPRFITGLDLMGQHHSIDDLRYLVQHEIDLYVDGEENTIKCKRQFHTAKRYRKCKAFIARCEAGLEGA